MSGFYNINHQRFMLRLADGWPRLSSLNWNLPTINSRKINGVQGSVRFSKAIAMGQKLAVTKHVHNLQKLKKHSIHSPRMMAVLNLACQR